MRGTSRCRDCDDVTGVSPADALASERLALPVQTTVERIDGGWRLRTADAPWFEDGNLLHLDQEPETPRAGPYAFVTEGAGPPRATVDQTLAVMRLDVLRSAGQTQDDGLVLRPVVDEADVAALAAVFAHFDWDAAPPRYWRWRAQRFAERDNGTFWLARLDGRPVGCAGLFTDGRLATVQDVAVTGPRRGRRLGSTLVTAVIAAHRAVHPATTVLLQVEPDSPAQRFYERLGFGRWGSAHAVRAPRTDT